MNADVGHAPGGHIFILHTFQSARKLEIIEIAERIDFYDSLETFFGNVHHEALCHIQLRNNIDPETPSLKLALDEAKEALQSAERRCEAMAVKLQAAKNQQAALRAWLAALHSTFSWRLTKPVRFLSRTFRRIVLV